MQKQTETHKIGGEMAQSHRVKQSGLLRRFGMRPTLRKALVATVALAIVGLIVAIKFAGPQPFSIARDATTELGSTDDTQDTSQNSQVNPQVEVESKENTNPQVDSSNITDSSSSNQESGEIALLIVDVDGAVESPGVYELASNRNRVRDAIEAAGGLLESADTARLNLAAPVEDGQKIYVLSVGENPSNATAANASAYSGTSSSSASAGASSDQSSSGTSASQGASSLVNINTAGADELQTLTGIGEATAAAIIEERESNGPFESVDDLMRVSGIGEKKLAKIRDQVCV